MLLLLFFIIQWYKRGAAYEASACLCERLVRELPEKALTGREKQKLNTQISHLFKASDKLREYENSLEILGDRNSYSKTDPDAPSCASRKMP